MNKKLAFIILLALDISCIFVLVFFYKEINGLNSDIQSHADSVSFNSKDGFFILALVVPIGHLIAIIEHFWRNVIKRHIRLINYGFLVMLILSFISAITISILIKAKVENAGYVNCKELEWSGTYSVSYTYTLNQAVCEQLVAEKAKEK